MKHPLGKIKYGETRRVMQQLDATFGDAKVCPDVLLVTAKQAAAMCGKSLRTWRTWDSAGRIPRPVRIGRSTLWRIGELQRWVAAGCPRRKDWETRM
jgi:predicted DNA-binding transcriptional regulator AlpA